MSTVETAPPPKSAEPSKTDVALTLMNMAMGIIKQDPDNGAATAAHLHNAIECRAMRL